MARGKRRGLGRRLAVLEAIEPEYGHGADFDYAPRRTPVVCRRHGRIGFLGFGAKLGPVEPGGPIPVETFWCEGCAYRFEFGGLIQFMCQGKDLLLVG